MARQRGREWHGTIDTQSLAVEGEYKELAWGPCGGVGWGGGTQPNFQGMSTIVKAPIRYHNPIAIYRVRSKLHSITTMATKVHMVLQSFVVLTWVRDSIELV